MYQKKFLPLKTIGFWLAKYLRKCRKYLRLKTFAILKLILIIKIILSNLSQYKNHRLCDA